MPERGGFGSRVVRRGGRGGGYRNDGYRPPRRDDAEPRYEKGNNNEEGDYDRPQRRRYPRYMDPLAPRGGRGGGPRRGTGRRSSERNEEGGEAGDAPVETEARRPPAGGQQRRRRRNRASVTKDAEKSGADSAREHSGGESDDDRRNETDGGATSDGEGKPVKRAPRPRRTLAPRPPRPAPRPRRSRLPKVYTPEEFNKVQEPVEKLSKRLGGKKDADEEDVNEAIKELVKFFEEAELKNPYEVALKMLMCAVAFENSGALYTPILQALDLVIRGEDGKESMLTQELQGIAFVLSRVQELAPCADEIATLFDLKGAAGDKLKYYVGELLKFHLYKQALNEVLENELEKDFNVEQVVVPLVIQHNIGPVEEMLKKNPHYLEPLIRYLDNIIGLSYAEMSAEVEKYEVPYMIGLGRQFLVRIILGWQAQFNFALNWCPNIKLFFARTHLYYLNRRRFRMVDLPYINWLELIIDLVDETPEVAADIVDELVRYGAGAEAKYWAELYSLKIEDMAEAVQKALEAVEEDFNVEEAKKTTLKPREGDSLINLELKDDQIKFVGTNDECLRAFDEIAQKGKVGIDVEWKPDTGILPNVVSVLQLATEDSVYLFDVTALKSNPTFLDGLNNKVLLNGDLVKIGFNVSRDVNFLERSLGTELKFKEAQRIVDLRDLQDKFYNGKVDFLFPNANRKDFRRRVFSGYETRQIRGLNSLVKAVFDKNLDRVELMSNWENRPLRQSQMRFAASDTYVLVKIYDEVSELAEKNGKDLEELLKSAPIPARGERRRSGGEVRKDGEASGSGEEKTGDESGRSSRNEADRRRPPPRAFGGRYPPYGGYGGYGGYRGRGRGGRFRGSYYRSAPAPMPRAPRTHPPANQKEEILEDGRVPEIMSSPKKPTDLKIVTDSMLLGLGKALKAHGVDVIVLRRTDRHSDAVDHCKREKRVILTQGRIFYEMKDQVSPGYCFKVVNRKVDQQVEEVLNAYQVEIDETEGGKQDAAEVSANDGSVFTGVKEMDEDIEEYLDELDASFHEEREHRCCTM